MEEESTDYFKYGTFKNSDADILKPELEKKGIPVKVLYPGTNVGREATAGAYWYDYTLMIRACDFKLAEEIRKKFNISFIKEKDTGFPLIGEANFLEGVIKHHYKSPIMIFASYYFGLFLSSAAIFFLLLATASLARGRPFYPSAILGILVLLFIFFASGFYVIRLMRKMISIILQKDKTFKIIAFFGLFLPTLLAIMILILLGIALFTTGSFT
jgi:hypothetical protein